MWVKFISLKNLNHFTNKPQTQSQTNPKLTFLFVPLSFHSIYYLGNCRCLLPPTCSIHYSVSHPKWAKHQGFLRDLYTTS